MGLQGNTEAFVLFNFSINYLKINAKFADNIRPGRMDVQIKAGSSAAGDNSRERGCSVKMCFLTSG